MVVIRVACWKFYKRTVVFEVFLSYSSHGEGNDATSTYIWTVLVGTKIQWQNFSKPATVAEVGPSRIASRVERVK